MANPMSCEVNTTGCLLHNLGNDYRGYFVEAPWPGVESCVIDSRTGAIFGSTLHVVKQQIKDCKLYDDAQRLKTSLRVREHAREIPPEQFWPWIIQMFNSAKRST